MIPQWDVSSNSVLLLYALTLASLVSEPLLHQQMHVSLCGMIH